MCTEWLSEWSGGSRDRTTATIPVASYLLGIDLLLEIPHQGMRIATSFYAACGYSGVSLPPGNRIRFLRFEQSKSFDPSIYSSRKSRNVMLTDRKLSRGGTTEKLLDLVGGSAVCVRVRTRVPHRTEYRKATTPSDRGTAAVTCLLIVEKSPRHRSIPGHESFAPHFRPRVRLNHDDFA